MEYREYPSDKTLVMNPILKRLLRALCGVSVIPLCLILGVYVIIFVPLWWILTGKTTISKVKEWMTNYMWYIASE